jgi:serine/threonine-protein kinase
MSPPVRVGRYDILRRLGKGMTEVYLALDVLESRRVALKLAPLAGDAMTRMVLEAERRGAAIQKELQIIDPRMVEVYETGEIDGYFYVAMQYVEGRTLAEVLRSERTIDPVRAAAIALELCEQLDKFHSAAAAVVHGDVKPSNIHLGHHDTVRLLDFGIAKTLRAGRASTDHGFGSPGYCSPERLERSEVNHQSDLWAVGATLYEMLGGTPPYQAEDTKRLETVIRSKRPPRALPSSVPRPLRMVAAKALSPNPPQRYGSARAFQADLQAFLEQRPTVAERERRASQTIEAARAAIRKATQTIARARRSTQVASGVGWFGAGMALWIVGSYGWQALQARPALDPPKAPPGPTNWAMLYREHGERALHAQPPDWQRAEVLLRRAVELGNTDAAILADLALASGLGTQRPERVNSAAEVAEETRRKAEPPTVKKVKAAVKKSAPKKPARRRRWR